MSKGVMGRLIIGLLCFVVIEMVDLQVRGGGLLCWGPSQFLNRV
jgi:hypothetical protein